MAGKERKGRMSDNTVVERQIAVEHERVVEHIHIRCDAFAGVKKRKSFRGIQPGETPTRAEVDEEMFRPDQDFWIARIEDQGEPARIKSERAYPRRWRPVGMGRPEPNGFHRIEIPSKTVIGADQILNSSIKKDFLLQRPRGPQVGDQGEPSE